MLGFESEPVWDWVGRRFLLKEIILSQHSCFSFTADIIRGFISDRNEKQHRG